jgi:hypothetical protein
VDLKAACSVCPSTLKKSHCLVIGPKCNMEFANVYINGVPLAWADKISYLGIVITKGKHFNVDLACERRSFSPLLIVFSASLILHLIWLNCTYVNLTAYLSLCTHWSLYHFQMLNCVISIAGGTPFIVKSSTIINGNELAN